MDAGLFEKRPAMKPFLSKKSEAPIGFCSGLNSLDANTKCFSK